MKSSNTYNVKEGQKFASNFNGIEGTVEIIRVSESFAFILKNGQFEGREGFTRVNRWIGNGKWTLIKQS